MRWDIENICLGIIVASGAFLLGGLTMQLHLSTEDEAVEVGRQQDDGEWVRHDDQKE